MNVCEQRKYWYILNMCNKTNEYVKCIVLIFTNSGNLNSAKKVIILEENNSGRVERPDVIFT